MQFAKAPLQQAQVAKQRLIDLGALDIAVKVERDEEFIYFPLSKHVDVYPVVERDAQRFSKPRNLGEALKDVLSLAELAVLTKSYDVVGSIAIIEIVDELVPKERLIAQAVLDGHPSIQTVLKKAHKHTGEFRTQALTYLAGEDTKETVVHESGVRLLVDVEQVYFSVRLSTERLRIASLVNPGEQVLVMFSGAGPYVVVLAKKTKARHVVGVEKNPVGHDYAVENLRLNKVRNAEVVCADCRDLSFLHEKFDRILMPLPATSEEFLPSALSVAKSGTTIHMYAFCKEDELPSVHENVRRRCKDAGFACDIVRTVKAGHHAPFVYRWCVDFVVK